jgi:hypothetical protein
VKTNQNHQRIAAAFDRLFRTYGPLGQGSTPEEITRDRIERIKVYFDAVALYQEQDVEAAVDAFLSGSAPGVNPNFAPPAPAVGGETRRQMNLRVDRENRERASRPKLPPPDIERSAESQQRVRDLMERTVNGLKAMSPDEDPQERHRKMLRRTNEYFDGERERGFTVGDDDGEEAA